MAASSLHQHRPWRSLVTWPQSLEALLRAELAPTARRYWVSLRLAGMATLGVGLVAICHVNSELGAYLVWLVIGAGPMMAAATAIEVLAVEALVLASSVVMARALAETPWLMLAFVFAFVAGSTFISVSRKLGSSGLLMQVIALGSLYGVIFSPHEVGWTAAANFGGSAIAFGLLVLFDNWLWPDRAEAILMETLGASAAKYRRRLEPAVRYYLDAHAAARPQEPLPTSELPQYLALLERAVAEGSTAHLRAVLLAAVTRMSRIEIQINRLVVASRENVARRIRLMVQPEIEQAVAAIAAALDEFAHATTSLIRSPDLPPAPGARRVGQMMAALTTRINLVRPAFVGVGSAEAANFAAFTACLENITRLIELLDEPPALATSSPARAPFQDLGRGDPMLFRYSSKVGICAVAGYVIGLVAQRPEFSVILTTIIITALPTYGASLRKMILRIVGSAIGGLVAVLAIIIVTPNFETLPSYLLVIFIVLYVSAYSSLSSGRIAYAGKQIGTTVLLVFAGLSPSADIYGPLWRSWGILLGTVVVTVIFFVLWPEYAGDSLPPRLREVIRRALALVPGETDSLDEAAIEKTTSETTHLLFEILEVADDAAFEGRASMLDSDAVVQAAGTLRRIVDRLAQISLARFSNPLPRLDSETEAARTAIINAIRERLKWWLARLELQVYFPAGGAVALAAQRSADIAAPLVSFSSRLEASGFARISSWTSEQRRTILSELQVLRRLEFLMAELDDYLSLIRRQPNRLYGRAA